MKNQKLTELRQIGVGALARDRNQPRKEFERSALNDLAASIKSQGILQPILARSAPKGKFMIIAGERRWTAAKMAGLKTVPVIVRDDLEGASLELAQLAENLQRQDLTDYEVAHAINVFMTSHPEFQKKDLAKLLNRSPSYISRMIALIDPQWAGLVMPGTITYASVLEAFKSKNEEVRALAVKDARSSGKTITHEALRKAEDLFASRASGAPRYGQSPWAPPVAGASRKGMPAAFASTMDVDPAPGAAPATAFRIGRASENIPQNAPQGLLHAVRMRRGAYEALSAAMESPPEVYEVEVRLSSHDIRNALRALGSPVPRGEFSQLPALMDALRDKVKSSQGSNR